MRSVAKTVYPMDYNRNNPMPDFNEWAKYIRAQVHGQVFEKEEDSWEFNNLRSGMDRVLLEAKQIINLNK